MSTQGIHIKALPDLERSVLIVGFDGWGNALNVSKGMIAYLIRKLKAKKFARIDPDTFYRYDESRPLVNIRDGDLQSIKPPGGHFYAARTVENTRDLILLKADEPNLRWYHFADSLFSLCKDTGTDTIITLGSMYDNVLHSDRIVSGMASTPDLFSKLKQKNVNAVSYQGPSAIHSIIQAEGPKNGMRCISLWSHCPFYLQGVTHFGILSHLAALLAFLADFEIETTELENGWEDLNKQIQKLMETSAELRAVVNELRKAKVRGSWERRKTLAEKDEKVINLKDFLEPKKPFL